MKKLKNKDIRNLTYVNSPHNINFNSYDDFEYFISRVENCMNDIYLSLESFLKILKDMEYIEYDKIPKCAKEYGWLIEEVYKIGEKAYTFFLTGKEENIQITFPKPTYIKEIKYEKDIYKN